MSSINISNNNYITKNLKTLRQQADLTQEVFGDLFGLTRNNIRSYESGTEMRIEKLLEIVSYFGLDLEKFIKYDMSLYDISKEQDNSEEQHHPTSTATRLSDFVTAEDRFAYFDKFSKDKLKRMLKALSIEKEGLLYELNDCHRSIIKLQQQVLAQDNKQ